ncbi:MAG TPA: carboxypeptidase M32 [Mesotoga sp.]|nr:carboxypeptidase M32 [Mesotoga sp.]
MELIDQLKQEYSEISYLQNAAALMVWDLRTYIPPKGAENRAEALGYVSTLAFKKAVSDEFGALLSQLNERATQEGLTDDEKAMVRVATKAYKRARSIPPELHHRFSVLTSKSERVWERARKENSFSSLEPYLEEIVDLSREMAELYGYEENPYDALLEGYEEGMTARKLRKVIEPLKSELIPFVKKILDKGTHPDTSILQGMFSKRAQEKLSRRALKFIGYDFDAGRLDETVHPFTIGIGVNDVRVTTKYVIEEFTPSLFGSIHEGGHAIYEQGLPISLKDTPIYGACSLGIHESQSRMMENIVGRSKEFLSFFYPQIQKAFPSNFRSVSLGDFYRAVNNVKPSLIRIEADEVTYNFHIMVRFELEEALMKGDLKVSELPAAWNAKMREYLGIEPESNRDGVLQDIHWPSGMIGYFPSYMLGNLYAAQMYAKARQDIPNLEKRIEKGDVLALVDWLRKNIHAVGRKHEPERLLKVATGKELDSSYFLKYVIDKYSEIYFI